MVPIFVFLIAAAAIGLTVWSASKVRGFETAYRYEGGFGGTHYETPLGLPNSEAKIQCLAGADQSALYLLKVPCAAAPYSSFLSIARCFATA